MVKRSVAAAFEIAMERNDLPAISGLIEHHPELLVELLPPGGWSIIYRAACEGRTNVVRLLLDLGVDPNVRNHQIRRFGQTAVFGAVQGHLDTLRLLLARGANPNATATNGVRPLHSAATESPEVCQALLDAGAEINAVVHDEFSEPPSSTALDCATGDSGNAETADLLRRRGAKSAAQLGL